MNAWTDEEREALVAGLEALQNRLRNAARPRPDRRKEYDHRAARQYYLAGELRERIETDL